MNDLTSPVDIRPDHLEIVQDILRELLPAGFRVWVFGSRANWTTKDSSDLDLAVEGAGALDYKAMVGLEFAFKESGLPYTVDVVDLKAVSPDFRDIVEGQRVLLPVAETPMCMNKQWREELFAQVLTEPVRNGVYKKKEFHGSGVKIVNMGELFAHPRLRDVEMRRAQLSDSEQQRFDVQAGDLLFARRSLVAEGAGKCSVVLQVNEPTGFESSIIRGRPDPTKVDSLFLYYYFNSPDGLHALDTIRRQVAVAGITSKDLAQLTIPVPPLTEQRAIAQILGTLDDKIELNQRMNQTLESMARAIFRDWFVDFGPVRAKLEGREPYLPPRLWALFPDRLVDSELGEVPDGWEVGVLDDAIDILSGGTPRTSVPEYWDGDIPWFTAKDSPALSEVFVLTTERSITQAGVDNSSTQVLPAGTTVITARGTVGHLACLGIPMAMNQTCYGIRGTSGYPDFFTYWNIRNAVNELQTRTHGTIFDTITRVTFKIADAVLPPASAAQAFDSVVNPSMDRILGNLNESLCLETERDVILPKLVSGEVRAVDLS